MASVSPITNLSQIRQRRSEVEREIAASKQAALSQISSTADDAKNFVVHDVVVPAAGIALGAFVLSKVVKAVFRSSSNEQHFENTSAASSMPRSLELPAPARPISHATPPPPTRIVPARQEVVAPVAGEREGGFEIPESVLKLGSLLVPAGLAIMDVIRGEDHQE